MTEDLYQVIQSLNDKLYNEGFQDGDIQFTYSSNGYVEIIEFLGVTLYNSEDDDREWDDVTDDYAISIATSIKFKAHSLVKNLGELRFV